MPDFTTPVKLPDFPFKLDYTDKIFFMGSCFAEHMGARMQELKFQVCHNPFGVVYNPRSMANNLMQLLTKDSWQADELSFHNELWFSYSHYTLFSDTDKQQCLERINRQFLPAKKFILEADYLILTLGTSFTYCLKETGEVVSNCHKIPASKFDRSFLNVEQSSEVLGSMITELRKENPGLKVIFTVSPIRHWKDGAIENQRSKAALILAISKLQSSLEEVYYFPAYEIFMDELRDYRWYASDMLHPSEAAQELIWEKFSGSLMDEESISLMNNVERIVKSVKHKPRFPNTASYQKFLKKTLNNISLLEKEHIYINFSKEKAYLK